ncbi:MAG: helix-turn-helix domain-containing protein [Nitrospirales bacterium]
MAIRSVLFSVLLLSNDQHLQAELKEHLKETTITVADAMSSVPRAVANRGFDAVIVEAKRGTHHELSEVYRAVDPARTVILAGSRTVLRHAPGFVRAMRQSAGQSAKADSRGLHLEDYINSKLGEFVKGMRNGSARNLHPMLIAAVERPLIAIALKEMNGNQIQAAQLLGMNRNTLRKKIAHLRIPVKRSKAPKVKPT